MVVVGGRNSANTKELTRLCEIAGTPAIQIEGVRDLDRRRPSFDGAEVVGVTGGTSTPIEDLEAVAAADPRAGRHADARPRARRATLADGRPAPLAATPGRPDDLAPDAATPSAAASAGAA